jgi:hypothetical protein
VEEIAVTIPLCPGAFLFACDTTDAFIMVGEGIAIVVPVIMLFVTIYLRGDWGALFYHSDKLHIDIQPESSGNIKAYVVRPFGGLDRIASGDQKGSFVIPRENSSYKSPKAPMVSVVVGGGQSFEANPYLPEYIERMGGKWPSWSGPAPPAKPSDLHGAYLMYAKWKAEGEQRDKDSKDRYITGRMADLEIPEALRPEEVKIWTEAKREAFGKEYDAGAWGPFTVMASKLEESPDPADPKEEKMRMGIYETLNAAIMSEPRELWPTWIAGHKVSFQDLIRFASPIPASQIESAMNNLERALKKDSFNTLIKFLAVGMFVLFALVGVGILLKLIGS